MEIGNVRFEGIIPPVSTIFNQAGKLDEPAMGSLIDSLIEAGVNGLFFLGTGGEFSQMPAEQRKEVAAFAVRYVNRRLPVLIGTGCTGTAEAVALSQHAEQIGADGVVVINPYYWPLSEDNLFAHYSHIAESVSIPILLYNFPDLTGQELTPDFVRSLADRYPHIAGIKDTVDQAGHIQEMIVKVKGAHPHFSVLCGFDNHLLNTLQLGGDGAISASGNFAPELSVGIYRAFQEGDFEKAIELHKRLSLLPHLYKLDSPFVNVVKEATRLCGLDIPTYVLPPAGPLSEDKKMQVRQILEQAGVLRPVPRVQ